MDVKAKRKYLIAFTLLLLVAFAVLIYFGQQKSGFHEDEYYSYYSTNYKCGWTVPDGDWESHDRYYNEFVVLPGEAFQYGLVKQVQSWDVHPPMYYWVLHTVCSFSKGVFSKWQGLGINIAAYMISLVFLYMTALELFHSKYKDAEALLLTACYAFSTATISSAMFIRMYSLMACLMILAVYIHVKAWQKDKMLSPLFLCAMGIVLYLGFLTHYYFMIFHFFLTAGLCAYFLIKQRKIKKCLLYGFSAVVAIALGVLTYPSSLGQMFKGQRGAEATGNFFQLGNTWERIKYFLSLINQQLFCGLMLVFAIVFIVILVTLILQKHAAIDMTSILAITAVGYFLAISKTALMLGDSSVRYIFPVFSLILLVMFSYADQFVTYNAKHRVDQWFIPVMALCILAGEIYGMAHDKVLFLYKEDINKVSYAKENADIPVMYIYHGNDSWCIWESADELFEYPEVYYISDNTTDQIIDDKLEQSKRILVYVSTIGNQQEQVDRVLNSMELLTDYEIVEESKFCNLYHFY